MKVKTRRFLSGIKKKPFMLSVGVFGISYFLEYLLVVGVPIILTKFVSVDEGSIPWLYGVATLCIYGVPWIPIHRAIRSQTNRETSKTCKGKLRCGAIIQRSAVMRRTSKWFLASICLGVGIGLLAMVPSLILAYFDGEAIAPSQLWSAPNTVEISDIGVWVVNCLLAPILEELWYRDLGLSALLNSGLTFRCANVLQSMFFALAHRSIPNIIFAFISGLLLGKAKEKSGRISSCIVVHGVINSELANFAAVFIYQTMLIAVYIVKDWTASRSVSGMLDLSEMPSYIGVVTLTGLLLMSPFWRLKAR